jgi:predicted PurR-regulated permease PerM
MPMDNSRPVRILLILLILLAALFLAQMLWQLLSGYADLILLFLLGWLVSFVLSPVVLQLSEHPVPIFLHPLLDAMLGAERAESLTKARLSRAAAVAIVYLVIVLLIVALVAMFLPTTIDQLSQLARRFPEYMAQAPRISAWAQDQLERVGIRLNVEDALRSALAGLQTYIANLIQNALGILTSLLTLLANLFFVLILGFYITLDGPRLRQSILSVIPDRFDDEIRFFSQSVDRTFGGFIRGQVFQALLQMIGTAVVMALFRLDFVLVASLFAGLFMLIPLVGPLLALVPPLLVAAIQSPGSALWVAIILFLFQFVIVNVLMPRVISDALGMHPLLVFAAILVSIKIAGFWGAFFGIPIVGVLWAMAVFFYEEWRKGDTRPPSQGIAQ